MDAWLVRAAAMHPDRAALEAGDRVLSYAELAAAAHRRAASLNRGEAVPVDAGDRLEFAASLHGCLLAGAAAVPIDPRLRAEERAGREASRRPGRNDVATVMFTSGTTGTSKRVELTYGNWLANALGSAAALGLDQRERWLCAMPLAHVGGLSILMRSVVYGTTVVLHERFETDAVLAELMDPARRITMVSLVPTMLARLLDAGLREPPALRWVLLGGGPIPGPLLDRATRAGVLIAPTYGMTEACSQIATFGWPLPGVELAVGDDDEILVRGPNIAPGAVADDGWLHTGDLGTFDARAGLRITGRKADTIITGGENVAPAEVEAVLLEHPAVTDAGVFARADAEWGEAVIAAVVVRDGEPLDAEALRAHCAGRLAAFKVPKAFESRPSLPRTESGKLLRREL